MSGNVVLLSAVRKLKEAEREDWAYQALIMGMDKLELLDEMIRFQKARSDAGKLTPDMMLRGKILFKELETRAETRELQILSRSYRRHLECELTEYARTGTLPDGDYGSD
jgi:hypothetical protein